MRTLFAYSLTAMLLLVGCSQTRVAQVSRPTPKPILIDEYSVLDDKSNAPSLSDEKLQKQLELARAHYLKALKLVENKDQKGAAKHFEAAVAILNDLVTHPDIDALPEYTRLSQSVVRDYEDKITSIESLDSTSSFFVLRDKMFQEIELLPVTWRRPSATTSAETGPVKADTLQIALTENEAVEQTIEFFTSEKGRKFFSKWLARSGRFFPMYERIFEDEDAPEELKYLSMIESGLNPTVTSKAQAVGLWQFISSTGKEYGMRIDWYRDERRDPEKATRAAAHYLLSLYQEMGDWHLALASYNCGPGRMRRAIRQADTADYWIARQFLPRETRQYVPLYIAAAKIARDPETYGFTDIQYEQPDNYEIVPVTGAYDFQTLSNAAGIPMQSLRDLNPELLRDKIPPGEVNYELHVPAGFSQTLAMVLDTLPVPQEPAISWVRHKVQRGETVSRIAAQYGVSVSELLDANGMTSKSKLLRGKMLKVPVPSASGSSKSDGNDAGDASGTDVAEAETNSQNDAAVAATPQGTTARKETKEAVAAVATPPAGQKSASVAATTRTQDVVSHTQPIATAPVVNSKPTPSASGNDEMIALLTETPTAERKSTHSSLPEIKATEPVTGSRPVADKETTRKATETRQSTTKATDSKQTKTAEVKTQKKEESKKKKSVVVHKVKRGETLSGIASKYGVSTKDVREWNPKSVTRKNDVLSGASLKIYQNGAAPAKSTTTAKSKKSEKGSKNTTASKSSSKKQRPKRYKVRRGETLNGIADKFGVSVRDLRQNNPRLNPSRLKAGQIIRLQ